MTYHKVMQMALDTLLTLHKSNNQYTETVVALREALTQPKPEPNGYYYEWDNPFGVIHSFDPTPRNGCPPDRIIPYYLSKEIE